MVTIPFNENVEKETVGKNVGINVGIDVGINKTEEAILQVILRDPKASQVFIASEIGKTHKKTGQWKVVK